MSQAPDQKSELHTYYAEPFESSISSRNTPRAAYFSRRARILVVALAAVFSVWLHLAHGVDTPALPVPASDGTRCAPSTEFDWYAVSANAIRLPCLVLWTLTPTRHAARALDRDPLDTML